MAAIILIGLTVCSVWIGAQSWELKGTLRSDASPDESMLWVELKGSLVADRMIVIESRDAKLRSSYMVRHVVGDQVLLASPLQEAYPKGSRIFQ